LLTYDAGNIAGRAIENEWRDAVIPWSESLKQCGAKCALSWLRAPGAASAFFLALGVTTASSQAVEEFYRGKTVRFIIHSTAGGDYDAWSRLVARHMSKYVPGNPTFLPQNMPGAGGITAANALYATLPQDGSVIGMIGRNLPFQALTNVANVRYDPRKFNWIGSPEFSSIVCVVAGDAPVKSAQQAFETEVLMGGAGAGTAVSTMPVFLNKLLGIKFRLVEGYAGSSAVWLAIERKEVHGVFLTLAAVNAARPGGLESGAIRILFNMEPGPAAGTNAPTVFDFAKTDEQRRLLKLMSISNELGRPILAPPNVPADRVAALRQAFERTMQDPELIAEATRGGLSIAVTNGDALTKLVNDLMATPKDLTDQMEELIK
jgi:tripartite-type tricarboxylate transporter receptor subunit TctC